MVGTLVAPKVVPMDDMMDQMKVGKKAGLMDDWLVVK